MSVKKEINSAFLLFDEGNKGYLDRSDIKCAFIYLFGVKPSKSEVELMINKEKGNKGLNKDQFNRAAMGNIIRLDQTDKIRNMFTSLDHNAKGYITLQDLILVFNQFAGHVSESTIEQLFYEVDSDHNGKIGFRDFHKIIKFHYQCDNQINQNCKNGQMKETDVKDKEKKKEAKLYL